MNSATTADLDADPSIHDKVAHQPAIDIVLSMESTARAPKRQIGGKAANLVRLRDHGHVPPWICVTTALFDAVLARVEGNHLQALRSTLASSPEDVRASAARVQSGIRSSGFEKHESEAILLAFDEHFPRSARVAVRSSSVSEDGEAHSFAGQFESYLNVQRSSVLERVLDCFASAFSPHCLLYRHAAGAGWKLGTAVVIQQMVSAASSGVLFTRRPVPSTSRQMVIMASHGLGEGVVQDQAEADSFVLDWADGHVVEREIQLKTHRVVAIAAGPDGTEVQDVPVALQTGPALTAAQLRELHGLGRQIEAAMGMPQDVEWSFDGEGSLHLMQTRPITTNLLDAKRKVFDCSNISENYHGATTALTFSYVRRYYEEIFRSAAGTFGMSATALSAHRPVFANLVSFLRGGAYYNLANWYRMFYAVPGFKHFVASFEHGVGLDGTPPQLKDLASACARAGERNTSVTTYLRLAWVYLRLDHMFAAHREMFEGYRRGLEELDMSRLDEDELLSLYEDVQQCLGKNWGTPLVNDYFAFNSFMLLEQVVKRWDVDASGELLADLMRGNEEPVSVEPIRALRELSQLAGRVPGLVEALADPGNDLVDVLSGPESVQFNVAMASYMRHYGDRRFDELKFEAPTLAERPEIVWGLIRNFLHSESDRVDASAAVEKRRGAESARATALAALKGHPVRRLLFRLLLKVTHQCLMHREYGRLVRSQRCGIERAILMALGRRLADRDAITSQGDIVHLSLDEIELFVQGSGVTSSLKRLIDLRRAEFEANQRLDHPLRLVTSALPQMPVVEDQLSAPAINSCPSLKGRGCSPGRVRGRARVITDPAAASLERGDILVARATDPAWAFLMATAAGLVVERGNLLSHAAIIGRELGIPCVIGVVDATRNIHEGQTILVDGTTGEVVIEVAVEPPAATPPAGATTTAPTYAPKESSHG